MRSVRLTPRFINRCVVGLALIAPIVYLFGSLFTGLIGAHGQQVYADEESVSYEYVLSDGKDIAEDSQIKFVFNDNPVINYSFNFYLNFECNDVLFNRFQFNNDISCWYFMINSGGDIKVLDQGVWTNDNYKTIYFTGSSNGGWNSNTNNNTQKARFLLMGSMYVYQPVYDMRSNSEYVFSQFFTSDNFVAKIGEDCMSANPHGFAPVAELYKYIDTNMLHLADYGAVGYTAYGYMYWCAHVLLLDLVFYVGVFFIRVIKNVLDKLEGGSDL